MKHRLKRVCEVLKRELGVIIGREIRFTSPLVTVNDVDITPDLKQAHIFVSALGTDAQREDCLTKLEQSRVLLQSELAKRVTLKHTPHLNFRLDDSVERGTRVISILDELGLEGDAPELDDEEDDEEEEEDDERSGRSRR